MEQIFNKLKKNLDDFEQTLKEVTKKKNGVIERRDNKYVYRETWLDDKRHGLTEWFDFEGRLKHRETNIDGEHHGVMESYFFNDGSLSSIEHWVNGKREGLSTIYNQEGHPISSYTYDKDIIFGECKFYYRNGVIKKQGKMWSSQPLGVWKTFDSDGNLLDTINFS